MNTIDKRKHYGIIVDTETANTIEESDHSLDMRYVLPYDIGFAVIDTRGNIYEKYSFVVREIFNGERDLMRSCYYNEKIPKYVEDIRAGRRLMRNAYEIRQIMNEVINRYNCSFAVAYNMRFDLTALNNLLRWTTKSRFRYWFPYNLEIWDSMKMAQDTIVQRKDYLKFCKNHNYFTANGQPRKTVEILWKFLSGNQNFKESHTGLEDVEVEAKIFGFCDRAHKPMRKNLYNPEIKTHSKSIRWWESVL